MSIRLNFLYLLVLVLSQVSCDKIKVNKIKKPDTKSRYAFSKQSNMNNNSDSENQSSNSKLTFRGFSVTFGENSNKLIEESYENPVLTCLDKNSYIEFYPIESSMKDIQITLNISYNFGEYTTLPGEVDETRDDIYDSKLCFLLGHYSPLRNSTDISVNIYINFLTNKAFFINKNFIYLLLEKSETGLQIYFNQRKNPYQDENYYTGSYVEQKKLSYLKCNLDKKIDTLSFKIYNKKFSLPGEGIFNNAFIEEEKLDEATRKTIAEHFDKNPLPTEHYLTCIDNIVDAMFSNARISIDSEQKESVNENSEKNLDENLLIV